MIQVATWQSPYVPFLLQSLATSHVINHQQIHHVDRWYSRDPQMVAVYLLYWGFQWRIPNSWMVNFLENPTVLKWMITMNTYDNSQKMDGLFCGKSHQESLINGWYVHAWRYTPWLAHRTNSEASGSAPCASNTWLWRLGPATDWGWNSPKKMLGT